MRPSNAPLPRRGAVIGLALALWLSGPAAAQPAPAPAPAPAPVEPLAAGEEDVEDLVEAMRKLKGIQIRSLFFSRQEMGYIRMAQKFYYRSGETAGSNEFDEADFLKRFTGIKTESQVTAFTYPQYFLDSIVFDNDASWTIWLSDGASSPRLIMHDAAPAESEIRVLEVDAEKAVLLWKPLLMEKVADVWQRGQNPGIVVNEAEGTVMFTLRPNQTFTSYLMKVMEGRLQPVTIGKGTVEPRPALPPADGSIPAQEGENQGLSGLINDYENMPGTGNNVPAPAPAPVIAAPPPLP